MKPTYRFARSAKRDLQGISDYWVERAGPEAALSVMTGILKTIATLSAHPKAGVATPEFGAEVRKFPARDYIIYYRAAGTNRIEILHLFHGARNQKSSWRGD